MNRELIYRVALVLLVLVALAVLARYRLLPPDDGKPAPPDNGGSSLPDDAPGEGGPYLFCFWNVENLFDDRDDGRKTKGDAEFDRYFGTNPDALARKLDKLCDVLVPLNDGRGPDILGVAEVESRRAAQLLADALNRRLGKKSYTNVLFDATTGGRHISCALITRLPVVEDQTEGWGGSMRILKGVVRVKGQDLTVVVSHWTSRVSDKTGKGRASYAGRIYSEYRSLHRAARREGKPLALLVCGDFNDNPDDPSVAEGLHATGDLARVKASGEEPLLFDLFSRAYSDGEATHVYGTKRYVFDHICVSPGLLEGGGWECDVGSARIVKEVADSKGRPVRFGGPNDKRSYTARGAADHFPVTVRLRVR